MTRPLHPSGRRVHAVYGTLTALFLADHLVDAIESVVDEKDPYRLYSQLKTAEDADYDQFFHSPVDDVVNGFIDEEATQYGLRGGQLFRNPAMCHTALLPAQTRYLGALTDTVKQGMIHYDTGLDIDTAQQTKSEGKTRLVFNPNDRQKCEVSLGIDYKDCFYAGSHDGWTSITIPNDAELREYGRESSRPTGIVLVCFMACPFGKCPPGDTRLSAVTDGKLRFEVNGQAVTGYTQMSDCAALRGENGAIFPPNSDGKYEIKTLVEPGPNDEFAFATITSIIVL